MKTNIKRILLLLTAVLLLACLGVSVSASSVSYAGGAEDFVFLPGSEYTDTDLFENFKNVMPGDTLTQEITVRNDWREADYIKVYLRAVPHDEENPLSESVAANETIASMTDFLSQLILKVYNGNALIFEGSPAETDGLTENILLGSFEYGEETTLKAVLEIPLSLGSEYAGRMGEVDWLFTIERHNDPIDFPTIVDKTKVTVRKVWKDTGVIRPDSIVAVLLRDGEEFDEVTLSEENNWTYTWDKLSLRDDWDVIEKEVPDGYRVSYYDAGGYITITNVELDRELTVEKVWVDEDPANRTESVTAQLICDGKAVDEVILNDANGWTYTWTDLSRANIWSVREANVPEGYTVSYEYDEDDGVKIINTWDAEPETVSWTVQKVWNANGAVIPDSVTVDLLGDGETAETVTLSDANDWTYTWDALDANVSWTVVETNIPENWTASYDVSGSIVTITNTCEAVPQTITVNKVWDDDDSANRPTFVTVQLYNGENAVESIQLGAWNNWTHTWTDLDGAGDWYVAETETAGYVPSYVKDGNTVTITNTASLIKTGQLKWPVAVLCGGGVLLILGGILVLTRKKKNGNA